MSPKLPNPFEVRPPTPEDVAAITNLVCLTDYYLWGATDYSIEELLSDWERSHFDLSQDAWVVTAPLEAPATTRAPGISFEPAPVARDRLVVGYGDLWDVQNHLILRGDGYVHPGYHGQGIGSALLEEMETRARQHLPFAQPDERVVFRIYINQKYEDAPPLLETRGFQFVRHIWVMETELTAVPPEPVFPEGICLRPYIKGQDDRAVYDVLREAFTDHWVNIFGYFEGWRDNMVGRDDFDPECCLIAVDGDEIAGTALVWLHPVRGWISTLGVRRPYRNRGLGYALIQRAYQVIYQHGITRAGLSVDSENQTGATRLYERAGMSVTQHYLVYDKELRPGLRR